MIRALVLDMDGVLRHWDPAEDRAFEVERGLAPGTLGSLLVEEPYFGEVLRGRMQDDDLYASMRQRALARYGETGHAAVSAWVATVRYGYVDALMLDVVRAVRPGLRTAILSNTSTRLFGEVQHLGIESLFDHVLPSSTLGYAKPEVECFALALARVGVAADECVFVDDSMNNVEAATSVGMHGIHFVGASELRASLVTLGVPVS